MKLAAISSNCSGCRVCAVVCALHNQKEVNPSKAALVVLGEFPAPGKYKVNLCDQCGACGEVCPVDAIYNEDGIYLINDSECSGCMNCIDACPQGVMINHKEKDVPIKCTNCGECVSICPRDAIIFQE